jgi:nanoRNase/pAp phosphatase (c-di-AMP/oligoRNAs hydrolase)
MKTRVKTRLRVKKLGELLAGKSNLLIVMQDNPDPDSIAAAVALRKLANSLAEVQCSITHGGTVGRAENRVLVRYLGLNLRHCSEIEFDKFDLVATVDTQTGAGNNCLPANVVPGIVVDHHPFRHASHGAQLIDIRRAYGATSTIMFEYLVEAGIEPEMPLATALLYGIRSDTQYLGRGAGPADIAAATALFAIANMRMLGEIQRGSVQREYFGMLTRALANAKVYGRCIITRLGKIDTPDMIGEVADLLERDEGAMWAMCSGFFGDKLLISVRTSEEGKDADEVVRQVVARRGTGGGHQNYAGGQIPLRKGTAAEQTNLQKLIEQKFLKVVGADSEGESKLI